MSFLDSRIRALDEYSSNTALKGPKSNSSRVATASTSSPTNCPMCKARHYLSSCQKFLTQNPTQRCETVKTLKRCFNCLCASHSVQECKSKYSCRMCSKRYHSLLHLSSDSEVNAASSSVKESPSQPSSSSAEITSLSAVPSVSERSRPSVLLATARDKIAAHSGRTINVRALLDQGSEVTFISET